MTEQANELWSLPSNNLREIKNLKQENQKLNERVANLELTVETLLSEVSSLRSDVQTYRKQMATIDFGKSKTKENPIKEKIVEKPTVVKQQQQPQPQKPTPIPTTIDKNEKSSDDVDSLAAWESQLQSESTQPQVAETSTMPTQPTPVPTTNNSTEIPSNNQSNLNNTKPNVENPLPSAKSPPFARKIIKRKQDNIVNQENSTNTTPSTNVVVEEEDEMSLTNVESEEEASDNDEDLPVLNFTHYTTNDDDEPSPPPAPSNTAQSHVDTSDDVVSSKEETKVSSPRLPPGAMATPFAQLGPIKPNAQMLGDVRRSRVQRPGSVLIVDGVIQSGRPGQIQVVNGQVQAPSKPRRAVRRPSEAHGPGASQSIRGVSPRARASKPVPVPTQSVAMATADTATPPWGGVADAPIATSRDRATTADAYDAVPLPTPPTTTAASTVPIQPAATHTPTDVNASEPLMPMRQPPRKPSLHGQQEAASQRETPLTSPLTGDVTKVVWLAGADESSLRLQASSDGTVDPFAVINTPNQTPVQQPIQTQSTQPPPQQQQSSQRQLQNPAVQQQQQQQQQQQSRQTPQLPAVEVAQRKLTSGRLQLIQQQMLLEKQAEMLKASAATPAEAAMHVAAYEAAIAKLTQNAEAVDLPDTTQRDMMQWTADRLVSRTNPLELYNVDRERQLGRGGFGSVFYGTDKKTGASVAIKQMKITKRNRVEYMLVETELHAKSSAHPNIVTYLDSFFLEAKSEFWVVLEYIDGCTLEGLLGLEKFKEPQMAHVTKCVCNALTYIHHMQRMHRDIKLGNVLIGPNASVKLTDFGLAAQLTQQREQRSTMCGTPDLVAPEIVRRSKYGVEVDVWALGMLVLKMCLCSPLIHIRDPVKVLQYIDTNGPPRLTKKKYSDQMKNFVERSVLMNPEERWTTAQLLKHEWLNKASTNGFDSMLKVIRQRDGPGGCVIQ